MWIGLKGHGTVANWFRGLAWPAAAAGLALAGLAGMAETAAVIKGATYSPSAVFGLGQLTSPGTVPTGVLNAWAIAASAYPSLRAWLIVYLSFDLVFMLGYLFLGIAALRVLCQWRPPPFRSRADHRNAEAGRLLLLATFLVNLAQVSLGLGYALSITSTYSRLSAFANGLHWLGALKSLFAILLIGWLCYQGWDHRNKLMPLARAAKTQRFSVLFVAVLAVIAILPGPNALEQMPDVQRAWISGAASVAWHAVLPAVVAQILLALIIFHLGRMRLRRAVQPAVDGKLHAGNQQSKQPGQSGQPVGPADAIRATESEQLSLARESSQQGEPAREKLAGDRKERGYLGWLATPVVVAALAGLLVLLGWARVSWIQTVAMLVVFWGVALTSFVREVTREADKLREEGAPEKNIRLALKAAGIALAGIAKDTWRDLADHAKGVRVTFKAVWHWLGEIVKAVPREGIRAALAAAKFPEDETRTRISAALEEEGERAERVRQVRVVGEVLAVAVLAIAGVGLVRSFTTPALMAGGSDAIGAWLAVGVGMIVAVLALPIMELILKRVGRQLGPGKLGSRDEAGIRGLNRPVTIVVAAVLVSADVWLIFFPLSAAEWLGVVATTVTVLGTLALGLAWMAHMAQNREPLDVFTLFKLKSTPVISVVVAFGVLSLALDQNSQLHQVGGHPGTVTRHSLLWQLEMWLKQVPGSPCVVPQPPGPTSPEVQVEPLVLAAAAGGGIRAAWWTAGALGTIADSGCGRRAVFAVSGVSGGSLGLAVVATTRAGKGWSVRRQVNQILSQIAQPAGLASAIDGLALRDNIAALTGIDFMATHKAAGQKYPDRAALLEQAWETADPALRTSFAEGARPHTVGRGPDRNWQLLFSTTAVRSNCRAVIATSTLSTPTGPANGTPGCLSLSPTPAEPALPDSYDLLTQLPCLSHIDLGTAVMLSARFAYITPSGVVQGCQGQNPDTRPSGKQVEQFIDGGYVDASGLATLNDIAPTLIAVIGRYNANAVAHRRPGVPVKLVVPVVAFLPNTPIAQATPGVHVLPPAWEPVLPLPRQFLNSPRAQLASQSVLMQQIAAQITPSQWLPCLPGDTTCTAAQQAAHRAVPVNLVIVAPQEQPGLFSVPLGWVLSQASQNDLNRAIAEDATHQCSTHGRVYCAPGTQGLKYLLREIGSHP